MTYYSGCVLSMWMGLSLWCPASHNATGPQLFRDIQKNCTTDRIECFDSDTERQNTTGSFASSPNVGGTNNLFIF